MIRNKNYYLAFRMDVAMLMARWTRSFIEKQIHYESKDLWNIETLRGGKINKKNAIKNQYLQITTTILKLVRISLNAVWISVTEPFAQYTQTSASTKVQLMEPSFQSGWSVGRSVGKLSLQCLIGALIQSFLSSSKI